MLSTSRRRDAVPFSYRLRFQPDGDFHPAGSIHLQTHEGGCPQPPRVTGRFAARTTSCGAKGTGIWRASLAPGAALSDPPSASSNVGRGCPRPVAGRSLRTSCPSLARCCLRSGILPPLVSSPWIKSSAAGCGERQPRKPLAFSGVAQGEKGHGRLFPRTVSNAGSRGHGQPLPRPPVIPLEGARGERAGRNTPSKPEAPAREGRVAPRRGRSIPGR
jgi:hypothetical protein